MRHNFKTLLSISAVAVALVFTTGCSNEKFTINGEIANAKDSTLYFEHNGLQGFETLDSVKLDGTGTFEFKGDRMSNPEFYRLRIAGQIINIAIDSTETVTVKGSYPMMATNYVVSDSYENEKIKELALKQIELQAQCQRVVAETEASVDSIQSIIKKLVDQYKDDVTKNYIFKEPMKAYSYFALFQYITVGNQSSLIFNPHENPEDVKVFGAVATSWDTYYPDSERGKNLHNIAIEGMKDQRIVQANNQQLVIDESKVSDAGLFNITLIDNKGQQRSLTDLKGKVVMLDFHLFSVGEESTKRIMQLRDLYNKYHAQGFEIYQISLDSNEHFWKTQTQHLPWVSVYDPDGMNSDNLMKYNVQSLPTFFLIDKNNVLQKRDVQIKDIDAEIRSML